ncbi:MAG TPA: Ig-like domain-containing protein [Candidatus Paceibacterota bacterium]|jgi:hypothetical protein|nr:Ig-like domain-containing protein [Candidatus Paceibacterota bacterium]
MEYAKKIYLLLMVVFLFTRETPVLFAGILTSSDTVTVSATVGPSAPPPPSVSGGGGLVSMPQTSVRFSGEAYPNALVTLLKNGENVTSVKAGLDGLFTITLSEQYQSTNLYTLYARDIAGNRSLLINYPLVVTAGYLTYLSGIRFLPTIVLDKTQVRFGDSLVASGYALPKKELQVAITDQAKKISQKTPTFISSNTGLYSSTLATSSLPRGNYSAYVKYTDSDRISKLINFIIGDTNILSTEEALNLPGDCNADGRINLTDFSVLAFWYKKPNPPLCVDTNKDGIVDLTDFSILAFYWTN